MKLFVTILLIVTAVSSGISLIQARQKYKSYKANWKLGKMVEPAIVENTKGHKEYIVSYIVSSNSQVKSHAVKENIIANARIGIFPQSRLPICFAYEPHEYCELFIA